MAVSYATPALTTRTWAELSTANLYQNVALLNSLVQARAGKLAQLMAVVKADAYGHGAVWTAGRAQARGITHFAVASAAEAWQLRQAGISGDIYLLGSFLPEEADRIVRLDVVPFLSGREQWTALCQAARGAPLPARAFLMVDTGMGREGMLPSEARQLWCDASANKAVRLCGIGTHFSSADEADSGEWTRAQTESYRCFVRSLPPETLANANDGRGNCGIWLTLCNSPATLGEASQAGFNRDLPPGSVRGLLFRAGLLLYGIEPCRGAFAYAPDLQPVLSWRARVTLVRDLPAGSTIGYGRTATLVRPSRIATLAAGYADGVPRRLGNVGTALLNGERAPLIGRVSMDQCQVDVTDLAQVVQVGDSATFVGTEGALSQTILDLAETVDTTPHELTCLLTRRVPRVPV